MPSHLPHPLAGRYVAILHVLYGLRESNRLFSDEMIRVLPVDAGFHATSDPQQFVQIPPD